MYYFNSALIGTYFLLQQFKNNSVRVLILETRVIICGSNNYDYSVKVRRLF